jgi:hypothetical protein
LRYLFIPFLYVVKELIIDRMECRCNLGLLCIEGMSVQYDLGSAEVYIRGCPRQSVTFC